MKTLIAIFCMAAMPILHADESESVSVIDGESNGFKITGKGIIKLETPTGEKFDLSEAFITKTSNWKPLEIKCVWSPTLVAVFAKHPRLTEIIVFDTETKKKIPQKFILNTPPWYENSHVIFDLPAGNWNRNTLKIETTGFSNGAKSGKMFQTLTVKDGEFYTTPVRDPQNKPGATVKPGMPNPNPQPVVPKNPPQHGIEFGSP